MENFIKTTDKETAEKLISLGFELINENSSVYTFLNCKQLYSEVLKSKKIVFSDVLTF